MAQHRLIDTFPQFVRFWELAGQRPIEEQVERWADEYMSLWPELLYKQISDYGDQGVDWREIARERVFPQLPVWMDDMAAAHRNLVGCLAPVCGRAKESLGLDLSILFVIYVGIGCGAGWATTLEDSPACLFGLENVVECGWVESDALEALTAHEVGHLMHFRWRERVGLELCEGPMWQLYEEGFAQRCEHIIMGEDTWHQQAAQEGWTDWCGCNLSWLAAEFLRLVDAGHPVNPFFGSWFDVNGWRQCGYFLGHQIVAQWMADEGIQAVALISCTELQHRMRDSLEALAE